MKTERSSTISTSLASGYLSLIDQLHPNALVAWDRDGCSIPEVLTNPLKILEWETTNGASRWWLDDNDRDRTGGLGTVFSSPFRFVCYLDPTDPLGVKWYHGTIRQGMVTGRLKD